MQLKVQPYIYLLFYRRVLEYKCKPKYVSLLLIFVAFIIWLVLLMTLLFRA